MKQLLSLPVLNAKCQDHVETDSSCEYKMSYRLLQNPIETDSSCNTESCQDPTETDSYCNTKCQDPIETDSS